MSQHRQDTPHEPSRWWVVLYASAAGITLGIVLRIIGTDTWTWVHLAAVVFGIFTAAVFAGLMIHKLSQREDARRAAARQAERQRRDALRDNDQRVAATGTWRGEHVGQVLTVRWDDGAGHYLIQGWMGDHWQIPRELPWTHPESLAGHLRELEITDELRPVDDAGTRAMRARLGLAPVLTGQDPGDTAVIEMTDAGLPRRAVGETLRPIDVARWRVDRTEEIPRQP